MKMNKFPIIILLILISSVKLFSQTENTDVFANLVNPISITENRVLHFGTITVSASVAGTCIVAPTGSRTATGGVGLANLSPTATSAAYTVSGSANLAYSITLPTSNIVATRQGGTETLTVNAFTSNKSGNVSVLSATSSDTFTVGATLNVSAGQVAGLYQGNFNVTVAYN